MMGGKRGYTDYRYSAPPPPPPPAAAHAAPWHQYNDANYYSSQQQYYSPHHRHVDYGYDNQFQQQHYQHVEQYPRMVRRKDGHEYYQQRPAEDEYYHNPPTPQLEVNQLVKSDSASPAGDDLVDTHKLLFKDVLASLSLLKPEDIQLLSQIGELGFKYHIGSALYEQGRARNLAEMEQLNEFYINDATIAFYVFKSRPEDAIVDSGTEPPPEIIRDHVSKFYATFGLLAQRRGEIAGKDFCASWFSFVHMTNVPWNQTAFHSVQNGEKADAMGSHIFKGSEEFGVFSLTTRPACTTCENAVKWIYVTCTPDQKCKKCAESEAVCLSKWIECAICHNAFNQDTKEISANVIESKFARTALVLQPIDSNSRQGELDLDKIFLCSFCGCHSLLLNYCSKKFKCGRDRCSNKYPCRRLSSARCLSCLSSLNAVGGPFSRNASNTSASQNH